MFKNIGPTEIIIVLVLVILFFGRSKIIELARGLGESSKELKRVKRELQGSGKEKAETKAES